MAKVKRSDTRKPKPANAARLAIAMLGTLCNRVDEATRHAAGIMIATTGQLHLLGGKEEEDVGVGGLLQLTIDHIRELQSLGGTIADLQKELGRRMGMESAS